jgi:hypothetical protein
LRNAAASFDDDFDIREPVRKKAARRPAPGNKKKKQGFAGKLGLKKLARYAVVGAGVTVCIGIMVNALVLQTARHPAPLFGTSIVIGEPKAPTARPVPKPVAATQPAAVPEPPPSAQTPIPVVKPAASPRIGETKPEASDPIARLLNGGPPQTVDRAPPKTVLGAQRALVRLGFVLKPNGVLGPQTKKALQLFEKDRHLPVSGELTPRLVKILAAESGLKIER